MSLCKSRYASLPLAGVARQRRHLRLVFLHRRTRQPQPTGRFSLSPALSLSSHPRPPSPSPFRPREDVPVQALPGPLRGASRAGALRACCLPGVLEGVEPVRGAPVPAVRPARAADPAAAVVAPAGVKVEVFNTIGCTIDVFFCSLPRLRSVGRAIDLRSRVIPPIMSAKGRSGAGCGLAWRRLPVAPQLL